MARAFIRVLSSQEGVVISPLKTWHRDATFRPECSNGSSCFSPMPQYCPARKMPTVTFLPSGIVCTTVFFVLDFGNFLVSLRYASSVLCLNKQGQC